jgi:hypothetical protein
MMPMTTSSSTRVKPRALRRAIGVDGFGCITFPSTPRKSEDSADRTEEV